MAGIRKRLRKRATCHTVDNSTRSQDSNQKVRNHQSDEHWKQQVAKAMRPQPITEELHLRGVAVPLAEFPEFDPDQEEAQRMDDAARGRHQAVNTDAQLERLAGRPHQSKSGHGGAEQ